LRPRPFFRNIRYRRDKPEVTVFGRVKLLAEPKPTLFLPSNSAMDGFVVTRRVPLLIPVIASALLVVGWTAIGRSEQLSGTPSRLVRQQIVWTALGIGVLLATSRINYRRLARHTYTIYAVAIVALIAVYAFPAVNGAHRWIRWGGIGLQPSEFAKVIFIMSLSRLLMHRDVSNGFAGAVLWPLAMATLPMLLILKQPDLGTSLVFLPVMFAMLFAAGIRRRDLVRLLVAGTMLLPLLWTEMSHEQRSRITALWEQNLPHEPATADGFHLDQAKRTLAQGGVWGTFFSADSEEAALNIRLPEAQTDSIFCVVGERFGMVGAALLLLLFALLAARCLAVAVGTHEPFGRLIAVGVAALFGAEVLINTGMMVGLLPITGLALPLVSYGGSDLVAHLWALGLVMNIGRKQSV
jgi:rod shape determining protein RodA